MTNMRKALCTFVTLLSLWGYACNVDSLDEDKQSLLDFKSHVTSDPLGVLSNWLPNSIVHHCNWTSITCDSQGRVQIIMLYSMQLEGTLSPSIANLSHLTKLDLFDNSFHGTIPTSLDQLQNLETLFLSANQLVGSIPINITALRKLQILSLGGNNLQGTIPEDIGVLSNLQELKLQKTNISGTIPASIGNLSYLESLMLYDTNIVAPLPLKVNKLTKLQTLYIYNTPFLAGPLPTFWTNISSLQQLDLSTSGFIGTIPNQVGILGQLEYFNLWGNNLTGTIPSTLGNCSKLQEIILDENKLTGSLPLELSKLPHLIHLSLSHNKFTSTNLPSISILAALSNCTHLEYIDMSYNLFSGALPNVLPMNLSQLLLQNNMIAGSIPWNALAKSKYLWELDISNNSLTGGISVIVHELYNLQRLALGNNKLEGMIPSEIRNLSSLYELSLSNNLLSGEIPSTIGNLQALRTLDRDHNNLSGLVPLSLGNCRLLEHLDISSNTLSGRIPFQVASLENIQVLFNFSHNFFEGPLPLEIGKLTHVLAVDVSSNRINGTIPASIGNCIQLQTLNVSLNLFEGPIPNSLGQLTSLQQVDLSHNNLSGSLPISLENLKDLQNLDLSFNGLTGEVPNTGAFKNLTKHSFEGNPLLCGQWMGLPACPSKTIRNSSSKMGVIATIVGVCTGIWFCIIVLGWLIYYKRLQLQERGLTRFVTKSQYYLQSMMDRFLFSYAEIYQATGGLCRENLLGSSVLVFVYKGVLRDGTLVAIKIFNSEFKENIKNFYAESKLLGQVKHRNVVTLRGICSEDKHKALVMDFMQGGNLEQALESGKLDFLTILNIALDVAHGLEYLHHHCQVQIVHCDIKPTNILLDDHNVAHVADFGICKLLGLQESIDSLVSTLSLKGTTGYIPPEYGSGGRVSAKGDVYSFGVTLLQMITGISPSDQKIEVNIGSWVEKFFPDKLCDAVDSRLVKEVEVQELWECMTELVNLALVCNNYNPRSRPSMSEVATVLESILATADSKSMIMQYHK